MFVGRGGRGSETGIFFGGRPLARAGSLRASALASRLRGRALCYRLRLSGLGLGLGLPCVVASLVMVAKEVETGEQLTTLRIVRIRGSLLLLLRLRLMLSRLWLRFYCPPRRAQRAIVGICFLRHHTTFTVVATLRAMPLAQPPCSLSVHASSACLRGPSTSCPVICPRAERVVDNPTSTFEPRSNFDLSLPYLFTRRARGRQPEL